MSVTHTFQHLPLMARNAIRKELLSVIKTDKFRFEKEACEAYGVSQIVLSGWKRLEKTGKKLGEQAGRKHK